MHLMLKWRSKRNNVYELGILSKENEQYIIKRAIKDGCMGIGNFSLLNNVEISNELFDFFKHRIVSKDSPKLEEMLRKYNLEEYDDMEILKITQAKSVNDRYWVEEI